MKKLTQRQQEIFNLLIKGYSYKDVMSKLNIAKSTLNVHLQNIFNVYGVNSLSDLIVLHYRGGLKDD